MLDTATLPGERYEPYASVTVVRWTKRAECVAMRGTLASFTPVDCWRQCTSVVGRWQNGRRNNQTIDVFSAFDADGNGRGASG